MQAAPLEMESKMFWVACRGGKGSSEHQIFMEHGLKVVCNCA